MCSGVVGSEWGEAREVEVVALEEVDDDRAQYRDLLVGRAAVDIHDADQPADDGVDVLGAINRGTTATLRAGDQTLPQVPSFVVEKCSKG